MDMQRLVMVFLWLFVGLVPDYLFGAQKSAEESVIIRGIYFTETGCSHCDAFLLFEKTRLEKATGLSLELELHDILSPKGYELCVAMLAERGLVFTAFPVLFLGNNVYQGSTAVEAGGRAELEYWLKYGQWRPAEGPEGPQKPPQGASKTVLEDISSLKGQTLSVLSIFLAGLLDGINPCAFSTLLFFLSFLGLRRQDHKKRFWTGISFIGGIFVAYVALGLGIFSGLRYFFSRLGVSWFVKGAVSLLGGILAVASCYDAFLALRGRAGESILQLPLFLKQASHRLIRKGTNVSLYMLAAFGSGLLVSCIELACTGQVYFPTLAYLAQRSERVFPLLLLYNLAFITPLLVVFVVVHRGAAQEGLRRWYEGHLVLVRFLTALFFGSLAVLVWQ
jgi:cytochrome c biogenesis protein CcdA